MKKAFESTLLMTIGLIIGLIVLLIFLNPVIDFLTKTGSETCNDKITYNSLQDLILDINSVSDTPKSSLIQITKEDCTLVPFNPNAPNPNINMLKPTNAVYTKPYICICSGISSTACLNGICNETNVEKIEFKNFPAPYIVAENSKYMGYIYIRKGENGIIISKEDFEDAEIIKTEMDSEIQNIPAEITNSKVSANLKLYEEIIKKASSTYNIPESLIKAIITQESRGVYYAISSCGAVGLMQLMPSIAKENRLKIWNSVDFSSCDKTYGLSLIQERNNLKNTIVGDQELKLKLIALDDRFDPEKNIMAGTAYLKSLSSNPLTKGDTILIVAAYNGGTCNKAGTRGALCSSRTCPGQLFYECLANSGYAQTRDYVTKVASYQKGFEPVVA